VQLTQLQGDALAQIAGADPGRFERLHRRQHALHVRRSGLDFGPETRADVLQIVLQIAVVGDGIGDHARDGEVDGRKIGEFELFDELFLQRLSVLVAEVAAAVIIARPRSVRGSAGLFAPGLVRDLHFGFFTLFGGGGIAVELGILLVDRSLFALAHDIRLRIQGEFILRLEHHVGLERLPDVRLQIERGQLQQPDGLLQLRRHGELLANAKLQTWLQHSSFRSKPTV
jgi:hypothetical protein